MKLYQRPLPDSDDANVRAWLLKVATNGAFNAVRGRRRRRSWLQRFAQRAETVRPEDGDPQTIVSRQDEAERVRAQLMRLPERQRQALILRSSGLAYAEIAPVIGVNVHSVGTILARAERALRELYERAERREDR
jgi:RNA polymerase sigma factor (sigma-70 family)